MNSYFDALKRAALGLAGSAELRPVSLFEEEALDFAFEPRGPVVSADPDFVPEAIRTIVADAPAERKTQTVTEIATDRPRAASTPTPRLEDEVAELEALDQARTEWQLPIQRRPTPVQDSRRPEPVTSMIQAPRQTADSRPPTPLRESSAQVDALPRTMAAASRVIDTMPETSDTGTQAAGVESNLSAPAIELPEAGLHVRDAKSAAAGERESFGATVSTPILIEIDRIDIRIASTESATAPQRRAQPRPIVSLQDYLTKRGEADR